MNIKQLMEIGIKELIEYNIESPVQKTRMLLANLLNKEKEYITINIKEDLEKSIENIFAKQIQKLKQGYPIQYITNKQEFMKLDFFVNENVLIPQPDTEILVEEIINILKNQISNEKINILDLCTGSGAIGISIVKYIENAQVTMTDISRKALEVAEKNAKNNKVIDRCNFIKSNMFEDIINKKYDVIISNPPYIQSSIIKELEKEVQEEPIIALDGGKDGLDFYKIIAKKAYNFLNDNGILALEIGYDQKENVIKLLKEQEKYVDIYSKKDLSGNDRIVVCKLQ